MDRQQRRNEATDPAVERRNRKEGLMTDKGIFIPKYRFDCVNNSLKEYRQTVATQEKELQTLRSEIASLKETKILYDELSDELTVLREIARLGAKNVLSVRPLIETGGKHGEELKERVKKQIRKLKKSDAYLFYDA